MVRKPGRHEAGAMTSTPPAAPSGPSPDAPDDHGPRVSRDDVRDLGRLRRTVDDRKVAGVAGGLARHLDVDPLVLRVAFVVLAFFGAGLILYAACWVLVPEEGSTRRPLGLDDRSRSLGLIIAGVLAALALMGNTWQGLWHPWPVALIVLVVLFFVLRRNSAQSTAPYVGPDAPTSPLPTYGPPIPPTAPLAPARPWPTKRRGPILFWFTMALIALAEGLLGIVDLADVDVVPAAYPALAVAIIGVMLLVGAFFGRAGGLILAGLLATVVLAGTTAADEWEGTTVRETPTTAAVVASDYEISSGELVLDLTHVGNVAALDGRAISLHTNVGRIEVILPDGLDAEVTADVNGPGEIKLFGEESGGIDISMNRTEGGLGRNPLLHIRTELDVGAIEVHYR